MRPEAQISDPKNWDTCVNDRTGWEDIQQARAIISRALDTGSEALPDPGVIKVRETGYPELGPVQIVLLST